jgi:ABC-type Fe3+ transport system permease subunit
MKEIKSNPAKTTLIISMGFLMVFLVYKLDWAILVSLIVGLIGAFFTGLSRLIEKFWFKLAYILSLIVPNILLGFIFFFILFPLSFLSKIFRKNDLLKLKNIRTSVYTNRLDTIDKAHFDNMW